MASENPRAQLDSEDWAALKALAEDYQDNSISRRTALGVMGAGAATGAVGASMLGGASAAPSTTDSDGDVGTPSNRVDVFGDEFDANQAYFGDTNARPTVINQDRTVSVSSSSELDNALKTEVPLTATNNVLTIDIADGTYSGPFTIPASSGGAKGLKYSTLRLEGNTTTPSNVVIQDIGAIGYLGHGRIQGAKIEQESSLQSDEDVAFAAVESSMTLDQVDLASQTNGLLAYGANAYIEVKELDFGSNLTGDALQCKHRGSIWMQRVNASNINGSVGGFVARPRTGTIMINSGASLSGSSGRAASTQGGGVVVNESGDRLSGYSTVALDETQYNLSSGTVKRTMTSGVPIERMIKKTESVGTSAKSIMDAASVSQQSIIGLFLQVQGSDGTNRFQDIVIYTRGGDFTTIASGTQNTPAARTYSENASGDVALAMGSDSYNVVCVASALEQL